MMKKADLYLRASCDYQFKLQKAQLEEYCVNHNITIRRILYDNSIVTGDAIGIFWENYIKSYKDTPGAIDFILFTDWGRISRNEVKAGEIIKALTKEKILALAISETYQQVILKWADFPHKHGEN
ncbi:recombinase family protein [Chitinophaga eiseniae]|uniref:Recombinase family protein n=1 Tax=Chitinophaga eiseniae TaxID=634771 RepID=A0A847S8G0_9BACT|nr:recombinase family protein [Chitinophaga eiseniae]NLR78081.1 recombinase family protein [Chitinophaga eiseniae]